MIDVHPEDRVLVAVMNRPQDLDVARNQGWYRLPAQRAARGASFEYLAFYFTAAFGEHGWAIHHYARILGHELLTRLDLLPAEPDHPRAFEMYYKLELGPLLRREPPIVSLRWRRVTFIYTTWDRFEAADEINDLFAEGGEFVDRLYHALREEGLAPERRLCVREAGVEYVADLALPCRRGVVTIEVGDGGAGAQLPGRLLMTPSAIEADAPSCLQAVRDEVARRGGLLPLPQRGK